MALGMGGRRGAGGSGGGTDFYSMISNAGRSGADSAKNIIGLYQQGLQTGEQQQQLARRDQARDAFGAAWSSGNPDQIHSVMQAFPEFAAKAQQMLGIQDDQERKDVGNLAYALQTMIEGGDIDGAKAMVGQNSRLFSRRGGVDHVLGALDEAQGDEQKRARITNWLKSLEGISLSGQEREQNRQSDVKLDQGWRGLDLREQGLSTQYALGQQRIGMQGQRLAETAGYHQQMLELRRAQLQGQGEGQMLDSEGNPLSPFEYNNYVVKTGHDPRTGKSLSGPMLKNSQEWMKGNRAFSAAQTTLNQQLGKVNNLLGDDEGLSQATGRLVGRAPAIAISEKGVQARNLIDSLKSGEFITNVQSMRGMGALSNAEGSKLMDLTAKLDITQPTAVVKKQVRAIRDQYQALQRANEQDAEDMGYSHASLEAYKNKPDEATPVQAGKENHSSLWGG